MSEFEGGGYSDESAGQPVFGEPQVARQFLEAPPAFDNLIIQAGSVATLEDIQGQMRTMMLGVRYRSPTLTNAPVFWCLSTRGADGEANHLALQAVIGQLELAQGRAVRRGKRPNGKPPQSVAEQGAIETQIAS